MLADLGAFAAGIVGGLIGGAAANWFFEALAREGWRWPWPR